MIDWRGLQTGKQCSGARCDDKDNDDTRALRVETSWAEVNYGTGQDGDWNWKVEEETLNKNKMKDMGQTADLDVLEFSHFSWTKI